MLSAVLGTVLLLASEVLIKARSAKCTGNYVPLSGSSGSFQTTNYPNKTERDETCKWNITVASGHIVKLSFADFDLGVRDPSRCTSANVLKVSNTPNAIAGLAELCGNKIPDPVFSFSNEMTVQFVSTSKADLVPQGFNATYEAIPEDSVCPSAASLSSPSGRIVSPYHPRVYPGGVTCTWTVTAPNKPYLELNFTAFNVEFGCGPDDCGCDYVELYDGNSTSAPRLGKYCGETLAYKRAPSVPLYSSQKSITVAFHAMPRQIFGNYKGFEAIWEESDFTPQVCTSQTVQLGGSSGTFSSPRYQDGTYVHSQTCRWLITVPSGSRIKLTFPVFELQQTELCLKDAVLVYEGNAEKGKPDWRLCNRFQEAPIVSRGQSLLVKFLSDNAVSYRGFTAKYEVIADRPSFTTTAAPTTPNVHTPATVVQLGGSNGTFTTASTTAAPITLNDAAGYTSSTSALFLSQLVLFVGFLA